MLRKNVKSLLEQFQVCIFAEIVFWVRCTLKSLFLSNKCFDSSLMLVSMSFGHKDFTIITGMCYANKH